jgi:hypothetical protein
MNDVMKKPCPPTGKRVVAIRESGARIIARRGYNRDTFFRDPKVLDWLNDNDKFIDVGFDRVIDWEPLTNGVDGNPRCCEICDTPMPGRERSLCRTCAELRDLMVPLMHNEKARAYLLSQFLDKHTADAIIDMDALRDKMGVGPRTNPRRKAWRKLVKIVKTLTRRRKRERSSS